MTNPDEPRVLVTGANGFMGHAVARRLVNDGFQVIGLFGSEKNRNMVTATGAFPVCVDLSSQEAFDYAADCDAVVHCAQPQIYARHLRPRDILKIAEIDRAWVQGLMQAGAGRCRTFIYPSGGWVYGNVTDGLSVETHHLDAHAVAAYKPCHEQLVLKTGKELDYETVLIFRSGAIYGKGGDFQKYLLEPMTGGKRCLGWVGTGQQWVAYVHVEDFAAACAAGIRQSPGFEILNICDDAQVRVGDAIRYLAELTNAPTPRAVPKWLFWIARGVALNALVSNTRMSNAKAKVVLGFDLRYPSFEKGFKALL